MHVKLNPIMRGFSQIYTWKLSLVQRCGPTTGHLARESEHAGGKKREIRAVGFSTVKYMFLSRIVSTSILQQCCKFCGHQRYLLMYPVAVFLNVLRSRVVVHNSSPQNVYKYEHREHSMYFYHKENTFILEDLKKTRKRQKFH